MYILTFINIVDFLSVKFFKVKVRYKLEFHFEFDLVLGLGSGDWWWNDTNVEMPIPLRHNTLLFDWFQFYMDTLIFVISLISSAEFWMIAHTSHRLEKNSIDSRTNELLCSSCHFALISFHYNLIRMNLIHTLAGYWVPYLSFLIGTRMNYLWRNFMSDFFLYQFWRRMILMMMKVFGIISKIMKIPCHCNHFSTTLMLMSIPFHVYLRIFI